MLLPFAKVTLGRELKNQPKNFQTEFFPGTSARHVRAKMLVLPGFGGPDQSFWQDVRRDVRPRTSSKTLVFYYANPSAELSCRTTKVPQNLGGKGGAWNRLLRTGFSPPIISNPPHYFWRFVCWTKKQRNLPIGGGGVDNQQLKGEQKIQWSWWGGAWGGGEKFRL